MRISRKAAQTALPGVGTVSSTLVDAAAQRYGLDTQSPNAAIRFISRATSTTEGIGGDARLAAATIDGGLQLAAVGAVPAMTINESHAAAAVVNGRMSLASTRIARQNSTAMHMDADGTVSQSGMAAGDKLQNGLGL